MSTAAPAGFMFRRQTVSCLFLLLFIFGGCATSESVATRDGARAVLYVPPELAAANQTYPFEYQGAPYTVRLYLDTALVHRLRRALRVHFARVDVKRGSPEATGAYDIIFVPGLASQIQLNVGAGVELSLSVSARLDAFNSDGTPIDSWIAESFARSSSNLSPNYDANVLGVIGIHISTQGPTSIVSSIRLASVESDVTNAALDRVVDEMIVGFGTSGPVHAYLDSLHRVETPTPQVATPAAQPPSEAVASTVPVPTEVQQGNLARWTVGSIRKSDSSITVALAVQSTVADKALRLALANLGTCAGFLVDENQQRWEPTSAVAATGQAAGGAGLLILPLGPRATAEVTITFAAQGRSTGSLFTLVEPVAIWDPAVQVGPDRENWWCDEDFRMTIPGLRADPAG